ncbi:MAG: hemerythrin domain-containing protein [Anaeromyxobacteraceae bacterium]
MIQPGPAHTAFAPSLLDASGTPSVATMVMMSHLGMRRDLALFARALPALGPADAARGAALAEEWGKFHQTLHGHHTAEDAGLFPMLLSRAPGLAPFITNLSIDHRAIDPVLARGDAAFPRLPAPDARAEAEAVVRELRRLLDAHLAAEEASIIPELRADTSLEMPIPGEAELAMYAEGFAWSSQGVADEVLERVFAGLPAPLRERLPAAREAFRARQARAFGAAWEGTSKTAVPQGL